MSDPARKPRLFLRLLVAALGWLCLASAFAVEPPSRETLAELTKNSRKDSAMYQLGLRYMLGIEVQEDPKAALDWFFKAMKKDYPDAVYMVGVCYSTGYGTDRNDREAMKYYRDAAEMGVLDAVYKVAICYEQGIGTPVSTEDAVRNFRRAADQGIPVAQYKVGMHLAADNGDYAGSIKWFNLAASAGYFPAQYELGRAYLYGQLGVPKDLVVAYKWFYLAGDEQSVEHLKQIENNLPRAQREEAVRQAIATRKGSR